MEIDYLGKHYKTSKYSPLTDEKWHELVDGYLQKPTLEELVAELESIAHGGLKVARVTQYYFRELMNKCNPRDSKWTIEQILQNKTLCECVWGFVDGNPFYEKSNQSDVQKFGNALRLSGKGAWGTVGSFPLKYVDKVLQEYNVNGNYYDFSCGWGVRMLGSLRNGVNYFGTDPNYLLVDKLHELEADYRMVNPDCTATTDIRAHGSEVFVPEWEGKIGVAFTSPPYFNIERYAIGNQSYKDGMTLDAWLTSYMFPTYDNIWRYLVPGGYVAINIKEPRNVHFIDEIIEYAQSIGFEYVKTDVVKLGNRITGVGDDKFTKCDEGCYIMRKPL